MTDAEHVSTVDLYDGAMAERYDHGRRLRRCRHRAVQHRAGAGLRCDGRRLRALRGRTLSPLRRVPDDAFRLGLRDLVSDARSGRLRFPVTERLDLVVFVSTESGSHNVRYP